MPPFLATKYLKSSKNEDIKFLGDKMNQNKWKGILVVLAYSLLPLPTTPLFLGGGISKIKPERERIANKIPIWNKLKYC
jgi:hypothetical protein